jgi:O-antigen ligase
MSVVIVIALVLGLPLIPRCWRVCLLLPLAVFQLFPPWLVVGQVPVPLVLVVSYAFWPELLKEVQYLFTVRPVRLILGLTVVTVVSFIWSVNVRLGLVSLNAFLAFVFVFAGMASQARADHRWIIRGLTLMYLSTLAFAASVVAFRFAPEAKLLYLKTNMATWFISSNTLTSLFLDDPNNVFDPEKSGGFAFVNGNAASTFLGVVAMTALGTGRAYKKHLHILLGLLMLAVVPLTGSKSGLVLIAPMLGAFALVNIEKNGRAITLLLALQAALILYLLYRAYGGSASDISGSALGGRLSYAADTRLRVWIFAFQMFLENPVLGQGFGGWQLEFPAYARFAGVPSDLPPHNTFIYLWSQSGIVALIIGIAFSAALLATPIKCMTRKDSETRGLAAMLALSYFWLLVQGFGENQGLIGDPHMQPIIATALAVFSMRIYTREKMLKANHV